MGTQHSSTDHVNNFDYHEWQQVSRNNDGRILANRNNHAQLIEEYPISISNDKQLQLAQQLYQFRVNDPELVSAAYFNLQKEEQMCSKSYAGHLYTQNIPIRLSNIVHVPFPDNLHIYNQALNGFHRLSRRLGYFKVNQDCVGVNNSHVAKVWHSPNFSELQPNFTADSQQDMVHNIVTMIQSNTDMNSMPRQQPSFARFLYQDTDKVGFGQAKRKLQLYANYFNRGVIPRYLGCVQRAGGAQAIRSKWEQTNNATNGYSNGYNNGYNNGNVNEVRSNSSSLVQPLAPLVVAADQITNSNRTTIPTNVQRNFVQNGPQTNVGYVTTTPIEQVNSTYTSYQGNSGYLPPTVNTQVEPKLTSSSQNFYRSQTFAPRAQSKLLTTQIGTKQPVGQRSAVFYSPPSVVLAQPPNHFTSSRVVSSTQPKSIYTTYRNQAPIQRSTGELISKRVATQPVQPVPISRNLLTLPVNPNSRPLVAQNPVPIIQSNNTVVNQAQVNVLPPPIHVASNNNINFNTIQSQNRLKTEQQIQAVSRNPSQKKLQEASSSSLPIVPSNTQVTIPNKQPSQTTIVSNQNQFVPGPTQIINNVAPIPNGVVRNVEQPRVAPIQQVNVTSTNAQNRVVGFTNQQNQISVSKQQISRQNIQSPVQSLTQITTNIPPANIFLNQNNVVQNVPNKITSLPQNQVVSSNALGSNTFISNANQASRKTISQGQGLIGSNIAYSQSNLPNNLNTTTAPISQTQIVQPSQPIQSNQIQSPRSVTSSTQPWMQQTLNWQFQQNFKPPSQVQQIQQIQSPTQQKPQTPVQPSPIKPSPIQPSLQSPAQQKSYTQTQQNNIPAFSRQIIANPNYTHVELNQANSVSSRYRTEQSPYSYSPQKAANQLVGHIQSLDLALNLKSPAESNNTLGSAQISTVTGNKLSKFGQQLQQSNSNTNTNTRNLYSNNYQEYTTQYSSNYNNNNYQWQNPKSEDYSSARFSKQKDNYQYGNTYKNYNISSSDNQYKNYDYSANSNSNTNNNANNQYSYGYGNKTASFNKDQKLDVVETNNNNNNNNINANINSGNYSFNNSQQYDYLAGYDGQTYTTTKKYNTTTSNQNQNENENQNQYGNNSSPSFLNKNTTDYSYVPNYSFESKKQYRQYNNGQLTSGYRVTQTDNNTYGYNRQSEDFVTGKVENANYGLSYNQNQNEGYITGNKITSLTSNNLNDRQLKQSMVEEDHYNVAWDPEILADLQANVHRN